MNRRRLVTIAGALSAFVAVTLSSVVVAASPTTDRALAKLAAGGHVLLMRHGRTTPGTGDPAGFDVEDCATQRNLSEAGRRESAALGRLLAEAGVVVDTVLSSRWCRALDTARAAFQQATPWSPLNSFFGNRAVEGGQTAAVRERIGSWKGPGTLVLVTHQVNITAITAQFTSMGEALVLAPRGGSRFDLVGRILSPSE